MPVCCNNTTKAITAHGRCSHVPKGQKHTPLPDPAVEGPLLPFWENILGLRVCSVVYTKYSTVKIQYSILHYSKYTTLSHTNGCLSGFSVFLCVSTVYCVLCIVFTHSLNYITTLGCSVLCYWNCTAQISPGSLTSKVVYCIAVQCSGCFTPFLFPLLFAFLVSCMVLDR